MRNKSLYDWCLENNKLQLLDEWDYEKNGDITPKNISSGNDKKVWWIVRYDDPISKKHFDFSWDASVAHRKDGRGCPYLSNPAKKIWIGFNDLTSTHPHLSEEWATEENDKLGIKITDVTQGSKKEVFWICKIHGIYKSRINARTDGQGCPYCAGKQIKVGQNDLAATHPDIAKEWDFEKNGCGPETVTKGCIKNTGGSVLLDILLNKLQIIEQVGILVAHIVLVEKF